MNRYAPALTAVSVGLALFVGGIWFGMSRAPASVPLAVYNGYPHPIEIASASSSVKLAPNEGKRIQASQGPLALQVKHNGAVLESHTLDLQPGEGTQLYNPGARGALLVQVAAYGGATAPPTELVLGRESRVEDIDHFFTSLPEELELPAGEVAFRRALMPVEGPPYGVYYTLVLNGLDDKAQEYADLYMGAGGSHPTILNALLNLSEDPAADCASWITAQPNDVQRHAACQDAGFADIEEYRKLAEANPDSAGFAFLLARLLPLPEGRPHLERALELEPQHPQALERMTVTAFAMHDEAAVVDALLDRAWNAGADMNDVSLRIGRQRDEKPEQLRNRDRSPATLSLADIEEVRLEPRLYPERMADLNARLENQEIHAAVAAMGTGSLSMVVGNLGVVDATGLMPLELALADGALPSQRTPALIEPLHPRELVLGWAIQTLDGGTGDSALMDRLRPVAPGLADFIPQNETASIEAIEAAVRGAPPEVQGATWVMYAQRTHDPEMIERARRWTMPPEMPYLRPTE